MGESPDSLSASVLSVTLNTSKTPFFFIECLINLPLILLPFTFLLSLYREQIHFLISLWVQNVLAFKLKSKKEQISLIVSNLMLLDFLCLEMNNPLTVFQTDLRVKNSLRPPVFLSM